MMEKAECCQETVTRHDVIKRVETEMLKDEEFADETHCKISKVLSASKMCVCDISSLLEMFQSAVSYQLASLKKTRLVRSRKQGKAVYYSLNDQHVFDLFNIAYEHIKE